MSSIESNQITNKGTGAGGANTNKNGLTYEDKTNLEIFYVELDKIYYS